MYLKTSKRLPSIFIPFEAHEGQVDKSGLPYILHPIHLAEQMQDETTTIAALLHDVVEDTEYTLEDLRKMGFSDTVVEAVTLLTYVEGTPYMEYVADIKENSVARAVKLADLQHNSDMTRLDTITERDRKRVAKYREAMKLLEAEV